MPASEVSEQPVEVVAVTTASGADRNAGLDPEPRTGAGVDDWIEELRDLLRRVAATDCGWAAGYVAELRRGLLQRLREGGSGTAPVDSEDAGGGDDDEYERLSGVAALVAGVDGYQLEHSDPMVVPGPRDLIAALLFDLRRVEMCLAGAREALKAMDFEFDWQEDDLSVEREAGVAALADAEDIIGGVRAPLIGWGRLFQGSRLFALDSATMQAVRELAGSIPEWYAVKPQFIVRAAVLHLAHEPAAAAIIAKAEQERNLTRERETGFPIHPNAKRAWPFTQADHQPWDTDGGESADAGAGEREGVDESDDG